MSHFTLDDISSASSSGPEVDSKTRIIALICAIASPLTYAVANTVDKIAISKRVRCTAGYTPYVGTVDVIIGILIGCAGDWSKSTLQNMKPMDYIYPIISGICLGICAALYFFALEWAEVSRVVGLESIYPLFVTLWSYIFLDDKIEPIGYLGIFFATFGGIVMSFDALRILFSAIITNVDKCSNFQKRYFENEERKKKEAEKSDAEGDNYGACWVFCRIYGVPYRLREGGDKHGEGSDLEKALIDSSDNSINAEKDDYISVMSSDDEEPTMGDSIPSFKLIHDAEKEAKDKKRQKDKKELIKQHKKMNKKKFETIKNFLLLIPIPIAMSGNDFFAKVSVSSMPINNVSALNSIGFGSVLILFIVSKDSRKHFLDEVKYNWFYGIVSEFLTILSTYLVIVGMTGLSAPIVSALSSLRPFFLLISETALRISTDSVYQCVGFKLFPILFIVAGVILITFSVVGA